MRYLEPEAESKVTGSRSTLVTGVMVIVVIMAVRVMFNDRSMVIGILLVMVIVPDLEGIMFVITPVSPHVVADSCPFAG